METQVAGAAGKAQAKRNILSLYGRIEAVKQTNDGTYTTVALPAPDEFSGVQYVSVKSQRSLGQRGEVIERDCHVHGYRTKFEYTDKKTGVNQQGEKVSMYLLAIE